jgi:hypothetical protein
MGMAMPLHGINILHDRCLFLLMVAFAKRLASIMKIPYTAAINKPS